VTTTIFLERRLKKHHAAFFIAGIFWNEAGYINETPQDTPLSHNIFELDKFTIQIYFQRLNRQEV